MNQTMFCPDTELRHRMSSWLSPSMSPVATIFQSVVATSGGNARESMEWKYINQMTLTPLTTFRHNRSPWPLFWKSPLYSVWVMVLQAENSEVLSDGFL